MKGRMIVPIPHSFRESHVDHDLLTAEQLARRLGVKARTVKAWLRAGKIPAAKLTPKVIRYDLGQVVNALERHQLMQGAARG
jgi:excisionase family DNA binding protein